MPSNPYSGYIPDSLEYILSLPQMQPNPASMLLTLPTEVDNSVQIFFPKEDNTLINKMYHQKQSGSCAFASSVWYTFTYEINRLRGTLANTPQRRFVPNGGYNYYNKGLYQQGTSFSNVYDYLKQHGAISQSDWGNDDAEDYLRWLSGYGIHSASLNNRIDGTSTIKIHNDGTGLELLKHYLFDHNEGSEVGGILNMGIAACGNSVDLGNQSAHTGEKVIISRGPCPHAVTIVGYCDDIMYDFNGDGQFTNHIDQNGDGIVDLNDWEIGGVRLANSYGTLLGTDGFEWLPYRFLADEILFVMHVVAEHETEITLKVKATHFDRNSLAIGSGYAQLANITNPSNIKPYDFLKLRGGDFPLRGNLFPNPELDFTPIEIELDFSYNHPNVDLGKVFLFTINSNTSTGEGVIHDFSLVDYRWGEIFELEYDLHDFPIPSGYNYYGIEYDLIPHETPLVANLTFEANMVSRFSPKVDNSSTLSINNGVRIDMYNSEITIENGSTLLAGNNVTFLAKRGNNKLILKGNATFGNNLLIKAEDGATIELIIESTAIVTTIENAYFENANITFACSNVSIEGSTFSAKPENKLIIERGGKLISNNNLFKSIDNTLWRGIEVRGNSNAAQIPLSNQGVLVINGGTIENAECGIRTWKPIDGTNTPDPNYCGGLVMATDANFVNNIIAAEFLPYSFTNYSFFKKCIFETNAALPNAQYPDYFVKLNGVSNIKFGGCSFKNSYFGNGVGLWGSGIYACDADVLVDQVCSSNMVPCADYLKSTFEGLYRGIYTLGTSQQRNTVVHNSEFTNNLRGMYIGCIDFANIKKNDFEILGEVAGLNPGGYGLYLDASTAFAIEENNFHYPSTIRKGIGLVINEAGPENNEVYNNSFENLEYGTIAQGYNKQRGGLIDGLCYKCNDFINNGTDIRISPRNSLQVTAMDGIAYHQGANIPGNDLAPAGNTFTSSVNFKDISNACNWIIYYHHQYGSATLVPNPADMTTNSQVTGTSYIKAVSCPSRIGSGSEKEEVRLALEGAEALAVETQLSLAAIVDGGSTTELHQEVVSSTPDEGLVLRNQLLTESPFLSDTILKTSIIKEEVLNNAMIRDVLVSNPQAAKSAQMLEMLDSRMVPMTDEMKNEVLAGQLITSAKENLEATLSSYKHDVWVKFSTLCNLYANDSLYTWQSDTIGLLLAGANTPGTRYQLAFWQLFTGNPATAQQVMNNIPSEFPLDASEQSLHTRYAALLNELIEFENNPVIVIEPGTAIYEVLMQLSNSGEDKPAALSRNILLSDNLISYEEPIKLDDGLKTMPVYKPGVQTARSQKLRIYPNPANTFVTVSWNVPIQETNLLLIHDAYGRQMLTCELQGQQNEAIVDIAAFVNGTYAVSLSKGGKTIATESLVIAR